MPRSHALAPWRRCCQALALVAATTLVQAADIPPVMPAASQALVVDAAASAASAAHSAADAVRAVAAQVNSLVVAMTPAPATYDIACAYVLQTGPTAWAINFWGQRAAVAQTHGKIAAAAPAKGPAGDDVDVAHPDPTACPSADGPQRTRFERTLDGGGYVVVVVDAADYDSAVKAKGAAPLALFLNGIGQGDDAPLIAAESDSRRTRFALLFHAHTGRTSQPLWTRLYDENGLAVAVPVSVGVGWKEEPAFIQKTPPAHAAQPYISVSNGIAVTLAFGLGALLLALFIATLRATDVFRDAPMPALWGRAFALRRAVFMELSGKSSLSDARCRGPLHVTPDNEAQVAAALARQLANFSYTLADGPKYRAAAAAVYGDRIVPDPADVLTLVGIAVQEEYRRPLRLSYSLARVQSGVWMAFAVLAALFLWVVYGNFPMLEGSVLALVAVSSLTTGASTIIDANHAPERSFSRGFLSDLLTSADGTQQAHRYQALVVNLLLLCVGLVFVVQHLAYPTFDPSWLGMLTLSGVAQTAGKQILETPARA